MSGAEERAFRALAWTAVVAGLLSLFFYGTQGTVDSTAFAQTFTVFLLASLAAAFAAFWPPRVGRPPAPLAHPHTPRPGEVVIRPGDVRR